MEGGRGGGGGVGGRFRIDRAFFRDRRDVDADVARSGFAAAPFTSQASEAELPLHFHADDIVTYVLRGSATFVTAEGERLRARKGDRIVIPARAVHATFQRCRARRASTKIWQRGRQKATLWRICLSHRSRCFEVRHCSPD